ncbi:MAG: fused MFS/spermidine synthase [Candidatus Melainabacteria bacterium]|nr:fused MFS/spermidine synthase [Candidatus Melainabacteria bacterium]
MSQTEEFSKGQPDKNRELPADWADEDDASLEHSDSQNDPPGQTLYLVGSAFFLSGLAALTYEVVWQRVLVRVIGATTPAIAMIICAFMIGLSIGGFIGARLARRNGDPLVVLSAIELSIGISALASIAVCQSSVITMLTDFLSATTNSATATILMGVILIFLLIAIPTCLMGATLPIIAGFFARSRRRGALLTRFYSINSAGAVFGAFLTGFFFLPLLGISGTLIFAAGLNFLSSSLAFLASRSVQVSQLSPAFLKNQELANRDFETDYRVAELEYPDSGNVSRSYGGPKQESHHSSPETPHASPQTQPATNESHVKTSPRRRTQSTLPAYFNAALALFTSALSFTMQIVWTRFLVFLFGSSTHALSLVLSVYIAGLTLGAWLISRNKTQQLNSKIAAHTAITLTLTSLVMACVLHQFNNVPEVFLHAKKFLLELIGPGFWCDSLPMFVVAIPLLLLPSTLIGMIFPLLLKAEGNAAMSGRVAASERALPYRTAVLYCASLLGSVVASAYSFSLLPVVAQKFTSGLEVTTLSVSILYALAALVVLVKTFGKQIKHFSLKSLMNEFRALCDQSGKKSPLNRPATRSIFPMTITGGCVLVLVVTSILVIARPKWDALLISSGLSNLSAEDIAEFSVPSLLNALTSKDIDGHTNLELLMYREGSNSTVSVVKKPSANLVYLRNNGKVEAAVPADPFFPAPESDLPTQKLLGIIPTLQCAGDGLDGLVIGYGSGTTCNAILPAPWVHNLTAVELEKAVWDARDLFPKGFRGNEKAPWPELQKKLTPVIADARNYLSIRNRKFDFIVSQPAEPWLSGASDLFTVEFYQLVKKRLKGTGMFCQWVPLYSLTPAQLRCLVQTFQHVFPQTTIWHPPRAGELILAGCIGEKSSLAVVEKRLDSTAVGLQLQTIGVNNVFDLYSNAMQLPSSINQSLEEIVLNTDDNLLIEGKLSKDMNNSTQNIDENFRKVFGDEKDFHYIMLDEPSMNNLADRELALLKRTIHSQQLASDNVFLDSVSGHLRPADPKPSPHAIPEGWTGGEAMSFYLHAGNLTKAAQLQKTVDASVADFNTLCDLGALYFLAGDYQKALFVFQTAEKKETLIHWQATAGIGLCNWMLGQWDEAIQPLSASLRNDPNQFLARYALGQILMSKGRQSEAFDNMRAAGIVDPQSPWPGLFVTAKYIDMGDWRAAKANLDNVLKRKSDLPEALAMGSLIAIKTDTTDIQNEYRQRYKVVTTRDITQIEMEDLATSILTSPHMVTKVKNW